MKHMKQIKILMLVSLLALWPTLVLAGGRGDDQGNQNDDDQGHGLEKGEFKHGLGRIGDDDDQGHGLEKGEFKHGLGRIRDDDDQGGHGLEKGEFKHGLGRIREDDDQGGHGLEKGDFKQGLGRTESIVENDSTTLPAVPEPSGALVLCLGLTTAALATRRLS